MLRRRVICDNGIPMFVEAVQDIGVEIRDKLSKLWYTASVGRARESFWRFRLSSFRKFDWSSVHNFVQK